MYKKSTKLSITRMNGLKSFFLALEAGRVLGLLKISGSRADNAHKGLSFRELNRFDLSE
jgi:hypothetical protein